MNDTIAAIATAHGASAVGIVRLSGGDALDVLARVFFPKRGTVSDCKSGVFTRGIAADKDGATLDDCVAVVFKNGAGYTGEPAAEIHCHGSPVALASVLRACMDAGARFAQPGEYTKRAFLNGKLDLTAAEAVADLIDAESEAAAKLAANQLTGALKRRTDALYSRLLDVTAHFHAVVDYPDEDIDDFAAAQYADELDVAAQELSRLAATFERGRTIKNGVPVAIVGKPNAGKSSLYNALLGYERAIVTATPGTTRDTLEERLTVRGILLRVTDTAGIREATDEAERLGVLRAKDAAAASAIVLAVFDGSRPFTDEDAAVIDALPENAARIAVVNKSDLPRVLDVARLDAFNTVTEVSAATGDGLDRLTDAVAEFLPRADSVSGGEILTNARQFDAVTRAETSVRDCADALRSGVTPDAALSDLEEALQALGELDGRNLRDDTVERIFERFCVGK